MSVTAIYLHQEMVNIDGELSYIREHLPEASTTSAISRQKHQTQTLKPLHINTEMSTDLKFKSQNLNQMQNF
jgi:hypothetical protein